jgi:hypothetical protein
MYRYFAVAAGIVVLCSSAVNAAEQVKIGAFVTRLSDIDAATDSFSTVVDIWTVSRAPTPKDINQIHPILSLRLGDTRSPPPKPDEEVQGGIVWGTNEFDATLNQKLDVRHFPFDRHTLRIRIVETDWSAKNLVYVADSAETRINPGLTVPGWEVTGCRIETHVVPLATRFGNPASADMTSTWPQAWILIDVRRNGVGVFAKIVLVAYISFALVMLSFLMDATHFNTRVSILVGSLFATVVNMRGSEAVLGRTDNFTLVDQIHLWVAFFILVSAITGFSTLHVKASRARTIGRWAALVSLVLFLIANAVLIGSALRA